MKPLFAQFLGAIGMPLIRLYWFIFRPETFGVKIVITREDQVLFIKHSYGKKSYMFPGGGIKRGESSEDAIKREVKEEVGIELNKVMFLGKILSTSEYKKDNIDVYTAQIDSAEIKIDNFEIIEARWFEKNSIPKLEPVTQSMYNLYEKN